MKIVVLDGFALNPGDLSWKDLEKLGECKIYERTKPEEIYSRIENAEAVITNKAILDEKLIDRLPKLKYIGVTATGYNVVDVQAAVRKGIVVTNIPAYSTDSVAQLVFSHILNVANRVEMHANSVKSGDWATNPDFAFWRSPQMELSGKTLGIVGFGRIGRKVAQIGLAFGMKVIFHNRSKVADNVAETRQTNLEEVFAESDVVSINCPLTAENSEFVNEQLLRKMKPTAILVNTGRGGLINEADLANSLNSGIIAAACLDVLSAEPPKPENPLLSAKNCFITPHIAWATIEARQRLMNITVENLHCFISGKLQNVVK
ncbi:MAG: glycerate dehydrogenase [Bacteroidetes bacterium GWB2_41_8]|nr:MAG: glycerate dehydrogenase [Bacteroidetes bacterium GWB2_41_8]